MLRFYLIRHGKKVAIPFDPPLRNLFGKEIIPHEIDPITQAPHILISECSITVIEKENDTYNLFKLNDTSHLSTPLT